MAGGDDRASELLQLVNDVVGASKAGGGGAFRKDCTDLVRRIALLTHLFEEIRDFKGREFASTSSCSRQSWVSDLVTALQAAKRLLLVANNFNSNFAPPVLTVSAHLPHSLSCTRVGMYISYLAAEFIESVIRSP